MDQTMTQTYLACYIKVALNCKVMSVPRDNTDRLKVVSLGKFASGLYKSGPKALLFCL